ncbi:HD domain-containing protein [Desulfobaculum senezii]
MTQFDTTNDMFPVQVRFVDLVGGVSAVLDLISPVVVGHHQRTAYIALHIARAAGATMEEQADIALAALLHDVGAFTMRTRLDTLCFDTDDVKHMETGYRLLCHAPGFERLARLIRRHHVPAARFGGLTEDDGRELWMSNIIQMADRIDVLAPRKTHVAPDVALVRKRLNAGRGRMFLEDIHDSFSHHLEAREFWTGLESCARFESIREACTVRSQLLPLNELVNVSRVIAQLVDFRSRFTATHSQGVAAVAMELGRMAGLDETEATLLQVAGGLHDVGKLAIPSELLEKPGPLDDEEYGVMKGHAYYSNTVLSSIPGLKDVGAWGARHHERLDGTGYPFQLGAGKLDLGARIMGVADVFTALTEDRPYRHGMHRREVEGVLYDMGLSGALDKEVVRLALDDYQHLDTTRLEAQASARQSFEAFAMGCDA